MESYTSIGSMSGTSLDGLDMVACRFTFDKRWNFVVLKANNISYSHKWVNRLSDISELTALDFVFLHNEYGKFTGKQIAEFCADLPAKPILIASHGHTIFHQPGMKLTFQIGNGAFIAAATGIQTVCDFRSMDVALEGQGAPLVPIGDELLFDEYEFCLNLGGIANVSFRDEGERKAFDICPANMAFNHFTKEMGYEYDLNGSMGRLGTVHPELLELLNSLEFYQIKGPKSLGREWFETGFLPLIYSFQLPTEDILRTLYEHVSDQLTLAIDQYPKGQVLITGGGTHNVFLIELFSEKTKHKTIVPSAQIIDFKEAIIFAFLGVLRFRNQINCLKSVTGADHDHCGGVIYLP